MVGVEPVASAFQNAVEMDGVSIVPLLKRPDAEWDRPAMTTLGPNNHAVRTERWRYIRYADGGEELYDRTQDPHEWHNLANDRELEAVKRRLLEWLPQKNAPEARTKATGKNTPRKNAKRKRKRKG